MIFLMHIRCMFEWIFMRKCIFEILEFFFLKIHLWMHDFCFECIYNVCLNDFILFMRKCIYEILTFCFWKCIYECMIFFLECIYNVCLNDFILFMRKCIYEILDFLFLKMHLWMYDFFFWNAVCLNDFFYEKMHL